MANVGQGIDSYLALGFESAFGTAATAGFKIAIMGEEL